MCFYIHFVVDGVPQERLTTVNTWFPDADLAANISVRQALPKLAPKRPRLFFVPFEDCACRSVFAISRGRSVSGQERRRPRRGKNADAKVDSRAEQQRRENRHKGATEAHDYASVFRRILQDHPSAEAGIFVHEYSGRIRDEILLLHLRRFPADALSATTLLEMAEDEVYWFSGSQHSCP